MEIAWVIGLIPLPKDVLPSHVTKLTEISKKLHNLKGKDEKLLIELDNIVSILYGLSLENDLPAMQDFLKFFAAG